MEPTTIEEIVRSIYEKRSIDAIKGLRTIHPPDVDGRPLGLKAAKDHIDYIRNMVPSQGKAEQYLTDLIGASATLSEASWQAASDALWRLVVALRGVDDERAELVENLAYDLDDTYEQGTTS
jgi:hypothetical protein